jgi:quercetin dioxygenase-like cupin family protein
MVRRVVTGHDAGGDAVFVSDAQPPHAVVMPGGTGVADLWAFDAHPTSVDDGVEPTGGFPLEPPPGGMWWRYIRLPLPDQSLPREEQYLVPPGVHDGPPGMHATDTVDVAVVVEGAIELETEADAGAVRVEIGDVVIQQGTQHRWRVVGDGPCAYLVAMFAVDHSLPAPANEAAVSTAPGDFGPRRIVVGFDADGRSRVVADGQVTSTVRFGDGTGSGGMAELWQTGGPVAAIVQGGDPAADPTDLKPAGAGIAIKYVELPPGTGEPFMHITSTVDLDVMLEGEGELVLPSGEATRLLPGDTVVQRGNLHGWRNTGEGPWRFLAIMVGVPDD